MVRTCVNPRRVARLVRHAAGGAAHQAALAPRHLRHLREAAGAPRQGQHVKPAGREGRGALQASRSDSCCAAPRQRPPVSRPACLRHACTIRPAPGRARPAGRSARPAGWRAGRAAGCGGRDTSTHPVQQSLLAVGGHGGHPPARPARRRRPCKPKLAHPNNTCCAAHLLHHLHELRLARQRRAVRSLCRLPPQPRRLGRLRQPLHDRGGRGTKRAPSEGLRLRLQMLAAGQLGMQAGADHAGRMAPGQQQ